LYPASAESDDHASSDLVEAHFSLTVCGVNNTHWTAYAFVDRCIDDSEYNDAIEVEEDIYDDLGGINDIKDDETFEEDKDEITEDPIIAESSHSEADRPIEDPREYFLHVFETRIRQAWREWESVISMMERVIKEHVRD
jgi:hypothetical protein